MSSRMSRRQWLVASAAAAGVSIAPGVKVANAREVTLRAVSAWTEGTAFSKPFERWVQRVNETGKGIIQINYLGGGAKIMNIFDMGGALRRGVFDILNTTAGYYSALMPEANAMKLAKGDMKKMRSNGAYEYYEKILNQKVNAHWLGQTKGMIPFYAFLSTRSPKVDKPDFSKLKMRVSPNYRAFFTVLGATLVQTQPSEMYTALERGVVDGYGWPNQGIDELGLLPVTKYRIEPGFFAAPNELLINLNTWNKLTPEQKKVLNDATAWVESWLDAYEVDENAKAKKLQADNGIEVINFSPKDTEYFLKTAYDSGWKEVMQVAPEHGPKLMELFS